MSTPKIIKETDHLDLAIEGALAKLNDFEPEDDKYGKIVDQLSKLYKIKETLGNLDLKEAETIIKQVESETTCEVKRIEAQVKVEEAENRKLVSKDTLAMIAGNLTGIVLILGYEHAHVVTSKALGFVLRNR